MVFRGGLFPEGTKIVGYARSALTVDQLKEKCRQYMKVRLQEGSGGGELVNTPFIFTQLLAQGW